MELNWEAIGYYLILLDAIIANIVAWLWPEWFCKTFRTICRHLPITKGWCAFYLVLVLWIGHALYRLGILPY